MRKRIALMLIAGLATLAAIHVQLALATPTATNGRIVYTHFVPALGGTVFRTVNPDGSQVRRVLPFTLECPHWSADGTRIATCGSPNGAAAVIINRQTGGYRELPMPDPTLFTGCPVWSPDGRRLACEGFGQTDPRRNGIYTIRSSDGKGLRRMTRNPGGDDLPGSYSPNGERLAFARFDANGDGVGIFVVNVDGSGLHRITPLGTLATPGDPGVDWSPQGNQIVFSRHVTADLHSSIWVVHANGSGLRKVNVLPASMCGGPNADPTALGCFNPSWSPDGTMIVFGRGTDQAGRDIYTVRRDGTGVQQITYGRDDSDPDWGTHPLIR